MELIAKVQLINLDKRWKNSYIFLVECTGYVGFRWNCTSTSGSLKSIQTVWTGMEKK